MLQLYQMSQTTIRGGKKDPGMEPTTVGSYKFWPITVGIGLDPFPFLDFRGGSTIQQELRRCWPRGTWLLGGPKPRGDNL